MSESIDYFDPWPLEGEVGKGAPDAPRQEAVPDADARAVDPPTPTPAGPSPSDRPAAPRTLQAPPGAPFPPLRAPTPLGRRDEDEEPARLDPPATTRTSRWRSARGAGGPSTPPPRPPLPPASATPAGKHAPAEARHDAERDVDDRAADRELGVSAETFPAAGLTGPAGETEPAESDKASVPGGPPYLAAAPSLDAIAELRSLFEEVTGPVVDPTDPGDEAMPVPAEPPPPEPPPHVSAETRIAAETTLSERPPTPADLLREVALPHLEILATRLRKARHDAVVQDLLGGLEPALRFHFRPWQGPFEEETHGRAIVLEIAAPRVPGGPDQVLARYRVDPDDPAATIELRAPIEKLDARWVERRVLEFLERALERA